MSESLYFILFSILLLVVTVIVIERVFKIGNLIGILLSYLPSILLAILFIRYYKISIEPITLVVIFLIITISLHTLIKFGLRFFEEIIQNSTNTFSLIAVLPLLLVITNILFAFIYWTCLINVPMYTKIPIYIDEHIHIVETTVNSLYDAFYFAFSISFSLPMNDILEAFQNYISSNFYLSLVQILHIISFKIFELIIIGMTVGKLIDFSLNKKPLEVWSIDVLNEIVIIKNNSKHQIDLDGYILMSFSSGRKYTFTNKIIESKQQIRIISGTTISPLTEDLLWNNINNWNNNGDVAILFDKDNKLISSLKS